MTIWLDISLLSLVIQVVLLVIWFRLRREVRETLAQATDRNEQSQKWLAHAQLLIQFARTQLILHGIEMPDPPDETLQ